MLESIIIKLALITGLVASSSAILNQIYIIIKSIVVGPQKKVLDEIVEIIIQRMTNNKNNFDIQNVESIIKANKKNYSFDLENVLNNAIANPKTDYNNGEINTRLKDILKSYKNNQSVKQTQKITSKQTPIKIDNLMLSYLLSLIICLILLLLFNTKNEELTIYLYYIITCFEKIGYWIILWFIPAIWFIYNNQIIKKIR